MGKSGVITKKDTGKDNEAYHDIITLLKIYRSVNWRMQVKIGQVKRRFQAEYGSDVDEFLNQIYEAGMDLNEDAANIRGRVEVISSSNKFLRLIDESVELMRRYHPQGEQFYWVIYYTYLSAYKPENVSEILDNLEPHFPKIPRINRATYFRWRNEALKALRGILWGYEDESKELLQHFQEAWVEEEK